MTSEQQLVPGMLSDRLVVRTQQALDSGALQPIATEYEQLAAGGLEFLVRVVANLERKAKAKQAPKPKNFNPFLPYEPGLFVADLSETHVGLLNKFNVVDHHLLMVTRDFVSQETWLDAADCLALAIVLGELDGLAFYNGGYAAGASQRHKHLQMVPFPFLPERMGLPIDPLMAAAKDKGRSKAFPFVHAIASLSLDWSAPAQVAPQLLATYRHLLAAIGLPWQSDNSQATGAYNLLVTREWMLMVLRSQPSFSGIAINSLGFAGSLLVRNTQELDHLKTIGPMTVLQNVGVVC
ncbi:phosphorylase [Acaryochloris sp. IP29b_bin.148]|uniref:ATP adenylyltransferase family protein n=1 Tax=Acaryochloris sp. IP29b_bin.148 TaxID=2969218 RepID=UPI0026202A7E|nr:phosphorylase [Acaryochloris sp. IP29b_bin.148]